MKSILSILLCFSVCLSQIPNVAKGFGSNRIGFSSAAPSTGTWEIGDIISDNSSGVIKLWYCRSNGTFSSFSSSGKTVSGSPHIYEVASLSGILIGQYATLSAGFSAGQKRVIAKSSHSGVTTAGATSSVGIAIVYSVSNVTSYDLGDYVQLSAGWPSTSCAYRITVIDTINQTLTVDVAAASTQAGITVTSVAALTVDANATSTEATCNITTTDPIFRYIGQIFNDTVRIVDTTSAISKTTGSFTTTGGGGFGKQLYSAFNVSDSSKIGSSGSNLTNVSIIDGSADTLSITSGGKTWKFLPVANQ